MLAVMASVSAIFEAHQHGIASIQAQVSEKEHNSYILQGQLVSFCSWLLALKLTSVYGRYQG